MTSDPAPLGQRGERVLAYLVAACVVVSIIAFLTVIIGTAVGVGAGDGFSHGVWPVILLVPYAGLPLGFLLLVTLLVVNGVRRRRENQADQS